MNKFDPYHKWLGIPPDEQPPNHYRLLGIRVFESDPDVISSAAEQRIVFLRSFQKDETVEIAQNLLNEVSAAMVCLLKPKDKAQYDQALHDAITATQEVPSTVEMFSEFSVEPAGFTVGGRSHPRHRRNTPQLWQRPWILALVCSGLAIILLAYVMSRGDKSQVAVLQQQDEMQELSESVPRPNPKNSTKELLPQELEQSKGIKTEVAKNQAEHIPLDKTIPDLDPKEETPVDKGDWQVIPPANKNVRQSKELIIIESATNVITQTVRVFDEYKNAVQTVAFSPNGTQLVTSVRRGRLLFWNLSEDKEAGSISSSDPYDAVAFNDDGTLLALGTFGGRINLYECASLQRKRIGRMRGHTGSICSISFSPDSTKCVTAAAEDTTIKVWDVTTQETLNTLSGHTGNVNGVAFSPDGKRIVSGSGDGTARIWDADTGELVLVFDQHSDKVWDVVFSPDGKQIISASSDKTVKVWDSFTGEVAFILAGHTDVVKKIAISPDGRRLATASSDEKVMLWDLQAGKGLCTYKGHIGPVTSISFSWDGQMLASAGEDRSVKIWNAITYSQTATVNEQPHSAIAANPTAQNELRFTIPDKTAQAGAKTKAADLYESKYQKPLTLKKLENAPASKILAQEILPLHQVANDSATKFVLLEMALHRSTESGDSALTWQIIDDLSKVFSVDGLTYRVHAITTWSDVITRRYRGLDLAEARLELLRVILLLIYQAESDYQFEQLEELYRLAGRQVTDDSRRQRAYKNLSLSVKPKAARHEEIMTLAEQDGVIDDSETQVQLGSYWCFELRDWPKGLAHLIQGSDELLKKNAQLELAGGNSVEQQMKIADTWWNYAKQLPRSKTEPVESHAAMWYQRALPQLPADEKTRIQKRLSGLTKAQSSQTQYLTSFPPSEIRMFMSDSLAPDYLQLKWHIFKVNENEILNGIWLHPPGRGSSGHIAFHLRRKFHGLSGTAVCLRNSNSALTFRVVGDGNVLWTSTPLQRKETFQNFQVNVSGIDKLELFIDCPGSHIEAHAAWVDPVLTR